LEDKLDGYIIDFVNLNAKYKIVLKEKFDDLQTIHNHNLNVLEAKLNEHIKSLDGSKHLDSEMKFQFKKELEVYVQELHLNIDKMEKTRLNEKKVDVEMMAKFRDENT
jgi:hypothetical protein